MKAIDLVSASAGTGKTYRISTIITEAIKDGTARPGRILATTFTIKAAGELVSRIRVALLKEGLVEEASALDAAPIGTVNAVCGRIVADHALELGLSPDVGVLDEKEAERAVGQAIAAAASPEEAERLEELARRMPAFEWVKTVERIVTAARANRIDAAELDGFRESSVRECLGFAGAKPAFTDAEAAALEARLGSALARFVDECSGNGDETKKTLEAVEKVRDAVRDIRRPGGLAWKDWLGLFRLDVGAKSRGAAGPVRSAAAGFERFPLFRADLEEAVGLSFELAARAMVSYERRKRDAGVMDFVDQERHALKLLEDPAMLAETGGNIDLLLVDEFQDTSPLQLAIFLKLASAARRTVWVGDQKQAIYGFRGTDPALMDAVIEAILGGREPETLSVSYRSRRPLVDLSSALFAASFAPKGLPAGRVAITAHAVEEPGQFGPPMERWILKSTKQEDDHRAVAAGVAQLLEAAPLVRERGSGGTRPLRVGDVAVLARKNKDCAAIARELEALGIPASIPRSGLLGTDLGGLALAGLKLWADGRDRLAAAELARLADHAGDADGWLAAALADPPAEGRFLEPGSPAARIVEAADAEPGAGPLAAFDAVVGILELGLRAAAWGKPAERRADLEAFRAAVRAYVDACDDGGQPSSVAGLVAWLQRRADDEKDDRGRADPASAVTVLTFHGAKGLEWPAVVLVDSPRRDRVKDALGVHVVPRSGGFDASDPLAGRALRLWPDPFFMSSKHATYYDAVAATPEADRCFRADEYEDLRLLYVSWTRARDILALASRDGKLADNMFGLLNDGSNILVSEPAASRATWVGVDFECTVRTCAPAAAAPSVRTPVTAWVSPGPQQHPPAYRSPSRSSLATATITERVELHPAMAMARGAVDSNLGTAVHAIFAADRRADGRDERLSTARRVLTAWGCPDALEPGTLLDAADALYAWIDARWPGFQPRREWPADLLDEGGSLVRGVVDLALVSKDGFVVFDHKCYPGDADSLGERLPAYAGQLAAYAAAIVTATGLPCLGAWLHFPLAGTACRVGW